MTPIEENAILSSPLDCAGFKILNLKAVDPVPAPLVSVDDPRLSDQRPVPNGSVTDASVASWAAIEQSKLNFNGAPPAAWLGNAKNQMAQGDLVQSLSQKNVAGGYVGLDGNGLIPVSKITTGASAGTVNSVGLIMPSEFQVANSPLSAAGTFNVTWANADNNSWFGVAGPTVLGPPDQPLTPSFLVAQLPLSLIPGLDGSKFTSGFFPVEMIPVCIGVDPSGLGTDHAPGAVPDPGESGDPNDYLGRDMKFRAFKTVISYQPTLDDVSFTLNSQSPYGYSVTISATKGAALFYRVNGGAFSAASSNTITLNLQKNDFVEAYSAKAGYNNSDIATYTVALPTPT